MSHMPAVPPVVTPGTFTRIYNVRDYGAVGDDATDDAVAITAAIAAAAATSGGVYGSHVYLPKGSYRVGSQIVIPNGVGLRGAGPSATYIKATNAFSATSMICNEDQDGTQEYAFIESLTVDANKGGGAVCSVAAVDLVSLFINSYVRDVIILSSSSVGLRIAAAAASGPVYVENVWVLHSGTHNVYVEEAAGNVGAFTGICFVNLTSEHQGSNSSAIYLKGLGSAFGWCFYNTHIEMGTAATGRTGITIDGVGHVLFDGVQLLATLSTVTYGIRILNVAQNIDIQIRGVYNPNLITPVISDVKNSASLAAINVPVYLTPDLSVFGGLRVQGDDTGTVHPFVARNQAGTDKLWIDKDGRVSGNSPSGGAIDLVADSTNARALIMMDAAKAAAYGFSFPGGNACRFRYISGGVDVFNVATTGVVLLYQTPLLNSNEIRHGTATGVMWKSGAGTPEGSVTAPVGSLFSRTDGGAGTSLYIKESGTGDTGWKTLVGV